MKHHSKQPSNVPLLVATCLVGSALFVSRGVAAPGDYATYSDAFKAGLNASGARDYAKSRDAWENAITLAQGPRQKVQAMIGLARVALDENQLGEAQKLCQDVLTMPVELNINEQVRVHLLLASVYHAQGKSKEAARETSEVQRLKPRKLGLGPDGKIIDRSQFLYGPLLGDVSKKSPEQIRVALESLVKDPKTHPFNRANALSLLGDISLEAQQPAIARELYKRAIAALPEPRFYQIVASYKVQLGDACAAEGDWKAARQAYESALADTYEDLKPVIKAKIDAAAKAERQNA